jgi:hypothetical protein
VVTIGRGLGSGLDVRPALRDLPDPVPVELSARVVDVIKVPYLKPIAPRRRRVRVGCPIPWPSDMKASLASPVTLPDAGTTASVAASDSGESAPHPHCRLTVAWPTIVGGAITACGYVLGRVATGGLETLGAALAVGAALLLAFVMASGAVRCGSEVRGRARFAAAIGSMLTLTAAAWAGGEKPPSG